MPTGSNPFTDPFLSGNFMSVILDGAGFSRTEKVAALCRFPVIVDQLKVCWEGAEQHENCSRCEKCLRTRLNLAAVGENEPAWFPGRFHGVMLRKLRAQSNIQIAELNSIQIYCKRRKLAYPWLNAQRRRIIFSRLAIPIENVLRLHQAKQSLRQLRQRLRGANPASSQDMARNG